MSQRGENSVNIEFFDVNIFIGRPIEGAAQAVATTAELLGELDDLGISQALVWHIDQYRHAPACGNALINTMVAESDRLWGCWTILPPQTDEAIDADFFPNMKKNRIFGLRAFPDHTGALMHHNYLLNRQVFGRFLDEVSERRIPLLLSVTGIAASGMTWPSVYELLEEYPQLTCILCDVEGWFARYARPLLEHYPNLYLETSLLSQGARLIESMVAQYGAERFVFGSGFPVRYPQAAMLQLLHVELSDEDKRKIASDNLENIRRSVAL